jgi:hypothetical protein
MNLKNANLNLMSIKDLETAIELMTEELKFRKRRAYLDDLDKALEALHTMRVKYTDERIKSLNGMTWEQLYCAVNQEYQDN